MLFILKLASYLVIRNELKIVSIVVLNYLLLSISLLTDFYKNL